VVLDAGRVAHDYSLDELVAQRGELRAHGLDFSFRLVLTPEAEETPEERGPVCAPAADGPADAPLVALDQYIFRYPDGTVALDRLDLTIGPGERIALVGENGAGKSTLLSCLSGLQQGSGRYAFDGRPVDRRLRKHLWREMGLVFQDCADQLFCASVDEEIDFGLRRLGLSRSELRQRREAALAMVGLEGFGGRVPLHLSGGERKRLALACVLAMRPRLLILDEPTAGLDPGSEAVLLEILRGLSAGLLLVSHDMFFVEALTCRTLVMHQGQILRDLSTVDFLRDRNLGSLNGLAYRYRQRGSDAIRALQHAHEQHHEHAHRHAGDEAAPEHVHAHTHRIVHSHPGDDRPHEHPPRRFYGDVPPEHDHDPEHDH
jgi:energy-coupling factor transporter ATP-binding protein EcfA2